LTRVAGFAVAFRDNKLAALPGQSEVDKIQARIHREQTSKYGSMADTQKLAAEIHWAASRTIEDQ
jgi:hypothetical protein